MSTIKFAVAAALSCGFATAALAQQAPSGVAGFYGGGAEWTFSGNGTSTFVQNNLPPDGYNQPFVSSAPFSETAAAESGGASAALAISATATNGNIGLRGLGSAVLTGTAGFESPGYAEAAFDLYAFDTFEIGGPSGAYEQFQYSLTLNGSAQGSTDGSIDASNAYGGLELFSDSNWTDFGTVAPFAACTATGAGYAAPDGNPCGRFANIDLNVNTPESQTLSGIITLVGGSTVQLGDMLWARASVGQASSATGIFDAANTGFFTLTPITPGASFTTDSGLTYAESPEVPSGVPEPSTWAMMLLGFGAIGAAMRRHNRRQLQARAA